MVKTFKESAVKEISVQGANYFIDLNDDGIEEILTPQKFDGMDSLVIKDSSRRVIFQANLFAMGSESTIYKLKLVRISSSVKTLILFLDEGKTQGKKFESTARTYFLSFENDDFSTFKLTQGPHHFHEKEGQREQYFRRDYQVNVRDVDGDGKRDLVIEYGHIQRIYIYSGKGTWNKL